MRRRGRAPEAGEKSGEDFVLFVEGQVAECGARVAAFEEHGVVVGVGFEEVDGGIAGPEAEAIDLVEGFEVGHADFEDGGGAVAAAGGAM